MKNIKLRAFALVIALVGIFGITTAVTQPVNVPQAYAQNSLDEAQKGAGTTGGSGTTIPKLITAVINILSWVVGVTAVIMIIVGGLRYVTSGGDSSGISSAKNTIIYALVGLVVAIMAQALVQFVLKKL